MLSKLVYKKNLYCNSVLSWVPLGFLILYQLAEIIDPEFPLLLPRLKILILQGITVNTKIYSQAITFTIFFFPTYGQCKLAPLLGINILSSLFKRFTTKTFVKINNEKWLINLKIKLTNRNHDVGENITKQLNDRERLSAALENNFIRLSVLKCMKK